MNAIQTYYKGYHFRSRLEARWAVFFDVLGIKWQYEAEGYQVYPECYYLPDFWLPDHQCFIEIKGQKPTEDEEFLASGLCLTTNKDVLIFFGNIGNHEAKIWSCGETDNEVNAFVDDNYDWHMAEYDCGWCRNRPDTITEGMFDVIFSESNYINKNGQIYIEKAVNKARSARFEYGETPK